MEYKNISIHNEYTIPHGFLAIPSENIIVGYILSESNI